MSIPIALQAGDHVAIVATAKRIEFDINQALNCLKGWGLVPIVGEYALRASGYFACTTEECLHDLDWALNDPKIKAIFFLRGGYGTTRIIDQLALPSASKWMVGYSDLTSMILQLNTSKHTMVHGAMCSTLGQDAQSDEALRALLFGEKQFVYPLEDSKLTRVGILEGEIIGGNLSLIYESIGAPNQIDLKRKILFLEEVGEEMYAIDRMLNKLKRTGLLNGVAGLVIGSFTAIGNKNNYFIETVEELICRYFPEELPKAVGLSAGHDQVNYPLLLGQNARLTISPHELTLHYLE